MLRIRFLLTVVHYAVTTLDRSTGRAANAIALCIVRPAGVAVPRATPRAIEIVGSHGVPGRVLDIDSIRGVTRPDNNPRPLCLSLADRQRYAALLRPAKRPQRRTNDGRDCNCRRSPSHFHVSPPLL